MVLFMKSNNILSVNPQNKALSPQIHIVEASLSFVDLQSLIFRPAGLQSPVLYLQSLWDYQISVFISIALFHDDGLDNFVKVSALSSVCKRLKCKKLNPGFFVFLL
ncbi:uncharacterized protein LOC107768605 [Nicotiana tabacum]|uniref:Uncharacterized protein LOC107768605 n=1 Tax=Nicotiana tabacum TaxID=4097 RepID=A0A1S3XTE2_TOBAC|nr:PREDICTED: uncharacterized protein LOC107768605 [Nicotiana tabacum]